MTSSDNKTFPPLQPSGTGTGIPFDETIAALASAPGPGLRGIVRISGTGTLDLLRQLLDVPSPLPHLPEREGSLGRGPQPFQRRAMRFPATITLEPGLELPVDVYLWPTQRSFTGQPLAELHLIGSPPLLNEVLERACLHGARPAERGEFTLRAFLAGRIDLVQAEAVLGVIEAGSSTELETALGQLAGGISRRIGEVREQLLLHLADLEAGLDFVEEDIEFVHRDELLARLDAGREFLADLVAQSENRMQSTGRGRVVLAGLPNAGKSTLFNRLVKEEAALVSPLAGTTRDYLSATMEHAGMSWELIDTAGWESPRDGIDSAAGLLRDEQVHQADLIVWCTPADLPPEQTEENRRLLDACRTGATAVSAVPTEAGASTEAVEPGMHGSQSRGTRQVLEIRTKADCIEREMPGEIPSVSAATSEGIDRLLEAIVSRLSDESSASEIIGSTAARCGESLRHALAAIERARELVEFGAGDELISVELREVLHHLGRIVGEVYTDDILDRIFSRFCIGK
jgi:tRNA modification GTPase